MNLDLLLGRGMDKAQVSLERDKVSYHKVPRNMGEGVAQDKVLLQTRPQLGRHEIRALVSQRQVGFGLLLGVDFDLGLGGVDVEPRVDNVAVQFLYQGVIVLEVDLGSGVADNVAVATFLGHFLHPGELVRIPHIVGVESDKQLVGGVVGVPAELKLVPN